MEIYKIPLCLIMQDSNMVHHMPSWSYINGIFIHSTYPITNATQTSLFHKLLVGILNPHYLYRGVFLIQSIHLHKNLYARLWFQYEFVIVDTKVYFLTLIQLWFAQREFIFTFRFMSWSSIQIFSTLWMYWRTFMIHTQVICLYLVPLSIQHNDT
jgi:arginine exporter protein ArgO